jgi:CDP-2,3-bis-(O-geranylgeranyl)-sn-glycerol synthase
VLNDIIFALWFFLPAGIANVVPIFAAHIPALKKYDAPIDGGRTFRGKRVFGSHKTWRGLITGVLMATLTLWLQQWAYAHNAWVRDMSPVDYYAIPVVVMGICFALGALGGDAIESFFKRQRGIAPGRGWFPFDQTDYIIGGALATAPFVALTLGQYAWLIVLWLGVHVAATVIGYHLGLKERPL